MWSLGTGPVGTAILRTTAQPLWLGVVVFLFLVAHSIPVTATMLHVYWYHYPPYVIEQLPSSDGNFTGVFRYAVDDVVQSCMAGDSSHLLLHQVNNQLDLLALVSSQDTNLSDPGEVTLLLPFATQAQYTSSWVSLEFQEHPEEGLAVRFLGLVESPGSVHFYKKEDQPVGSDLVTVILQGWPLLVLILLGAGYSGIIIWLLDRLWNPSNFPRPFIRGFWEGFWWAFVTMTTVGYGDTTPRSIQARVYGLVWIVVGITILSVFTATVTTVLTQETLGNRQTIMGFRAGVLNGTDDYRLALTKGALPIVNNSLESILDMLQSYSVNLGLLEQYSFAAQQSKLGGKYLMESMVDNPLNHGVLLKAGVSTLATCISRHLAARKPAIFTQLTHWIKPLTVGRTTDAENDQSLFQPRTIMYMWYGLGVWVVIFLAFICWEFFYWKPKHQKRKEMKHILQRQGQDMNDLDRSNDSDTKKKHHRKQSDKVVFQLPVEPVSQEHVSSPSRTPPMTSLTSHSQEHVSSPSRTPPMTSLTSHSQEHVSSPSRTPPMTSLTSHSQEHVSSPSRTPPMTSLTSHHKPTVKLQNGCLINSPQTDRYSHRGSYANLGFDGHQDGINPPGQSADGLNLVVGDNTPNNRYSFTDSRSELPLSVTSLDDMPIRRSVSALETSTDTFSPLKNQVLESLINRQKLELQELEEEFMQFVQDVKQRHKEEQRRYLTLVQRHSIKHNPLYEARSTALLETKDNRYGELNSHLKPSSPKHSYRMNNLEAEENHRCKVYHL